MDYEVVQLTEKQVAGLKIRTSNNDPQMGEKIGAIWQRFYGEGIEAALVGRENEKCIGTKEVRLAGIDCNTYFDSWSKYTKREIKKMFREIEK